MQENMSANCHLLQEAKEIDKMEIQLCTAEITNREKSWADMIYFTDTTPRMIFKRSYTT